MSKSSRRRNRDRRRASNAHGAKNHLCRICNRSVPALNADDTCPGCGHPPSVTGLGLALPRDAGPKREPNLERFARATLVDRILESSATESADRLAALSTEQLQSKLALLRQRASEAAARSSAEQEQSKQASLRMQAMDVHSSAASSHADAFMTEGPSRRENRTPPRPPATGEDTRREWLVKLERQLTPPTRRLNDPGASAERDASTPSTKKPRRFWQFWKRDGSG
jgi:hypothetical protein